LLKNCWKAIKKLRITNYDAVHDTIYNYRKVDYQLSVQLKVHSCQFTVMAGSKLLTVNCALCDL